MDITAEPKQMKTSAQALEAAARAMGGELQQLALASQTLSGAWEGDAKLAFLSLYSSFAKDAALQVAALSEIAKALGEVADDYASTDDKGAGAIPG